MRATAQAGVPRRTTARLFELDDEPVAFIEALAIGLDHAAVVLDEVGKEVPERVVTVVVDVTRRQFRSHDESGGTEVVLDLPAVRVPRRVLQGLQEPLDLLLDE